MSLLAGIVGSGGPPRLSSTITTQNVTSTNSNALTITGANANQIYILVHCAYNSTTSITAPTTPTGFSSIASSANNKIVSRVSLKRLTSNEASFTLPSVTSAESQIAYAFIYTPTKGTSTGSSSAESGFTYTTGGADPVAEELNISADSIALGFIASTDTDFSIATNYGGTQSSAIAGNLYFQFGTNVLSSSLTPATFDATINSGESLINLISTTVTF